MNHPGSPLSVLRRLRERGIRLYARFEGGGMGRGFAWETARLALMTFSYIRTICGTRHGGRRAPPSLRRCGRRARRPSRWPELCRSGHWSRSWGGIANIALGSSSDSERREEFFFTPPRAHPRTLFTHASPLERHREEEGKRIPPARWQSRRARQGARPRSQSLWCYAPKGAYR